MDDQNLSSQEFAKIIGVSPSKVSGWVNNKFAPNYDSILTIIRKFNKLNILWLVTGTGEMLLGAPAAIQPKTDLSAMTDISPINKNLYEELIKSQSRTIELLEEKNKKLEDELKRCSGEKKKEGAA